MRDNQEMMVHELSLILINQLLIFSVLRTIKITLPTITVVELINLIKSSILFASRAMFIEVSALER